MSTRDAGGRGRPHQGANTKPRSESAGTFQRLQSRGERLMQWFPELRKALIREGEPGIDAVIAQLQSLRGQVSKRAQETGRDLEERAERILSELERQAVRGLGPLLTRANVASHSAVETLERRLAHLEGRLGPLLDDRSQVSGRVGAMERQLDEVRADTSERLREITLQLANGDELRAEIGELRGHLDALSKDQVTRSLELGKQHDRLVRLEMRFGDFLKDHATQAVEQEQTKKRLAAIDHAIEHSAGVARSAADAAVDSAASARQTADRLNALSSDNARQRGETEGVLQHLGDVERVMRQLELRLGDLGERNAAVREELAALAARISHLELTAAQRAAAAPLAHNVEGH